MELADQTSGGFQCGIDSWQRCHWKNPNVHEKTWATRV